jgi:hypothetical protein
MKTSLTALLITLLVGIAHSASATPITFAFGGVVTSAGSEQVINGVFVGPLAGPSFAAGDPFTGTFTYDPSAPFDQFSFAINLGFGTGIGTTGSFTTAGIMIAQAAQQQFAFSPYPLLVDTFATLTLSNNSLLPNPIPSNAYVNLANYPDQHSVNFSGQTLNGIDNFSDFTLTGNITFIQSVPETGATATLFGLGFILVAALRKRVAVGCFMAPNYFCRHRQTREECRSRSAFSDWRLFCGAGDPHSVLEIPNKRNEPLCTCPTRRLRWSYDRFRPPQV